MVGNDYNNLESLTNRYTVNSTFQFETVESNGLSFGPKEFDVIFYLWKDEFDPIGRIPLIFIVNYLAKNEVSPLTFN